MPKFRKRPIVVEAEQWFPKKEIKEVYKEFIFHNGMNFKEKYFINTKQGPVQVNSGDWIIKGLDDEKYPCNPKIFEQVYEPVED